MNDIPQMGKVWRTECESDECGWTYEHERRSWVEDARENHEGMYRNDPGHETTEPEKATTGTIEE